MNTRYLATLIAVVEAGSLASAARRLGLSSATVSEQISALERELDVKLFERRGQRVHLTAAGSAILEEAREIISRTNSLRQIAQSDELRGTLRVGSISTALASFVPPALQELQQLHPDIEIKLEPATTQQLYDNIESERIDCAITAYPIFDLPKSYLWNELVKQEIVLVAPPGCKSSDAREILANTPFIRMDRHSWTGQIIDEMMREKELSVGSIMEMSAQQTMMMLVSVGMGATILPKTDLLMESASEFRVLPLDGRTVVRTVGLLSSPNANRRLVEALYAALRRSVDRAGAETDEKIAAASP